MQIVGICRFSFLGRGDWKIYKGKTPEEADAIAATQANVLFTPERMESRFSTFEHLTLASLKAQNDQDFRFIVLSSDLMPVKYKARLIELCKPLPQVIVKFLPITPIKQAQNTIFKDLGILYRETLQFRLDDDDCVSSNFISLMRKGAVEKMAHEKVFVASIKGAMYCTAGGDNSGVYYWPIEFFGAGAAMRHPTQSIFEFGHFNMAKRFPKVVIEGGLSLVTHNGTNDTLFTKETIRIRKMELMSRRTVRETVHKFFPFLTQEAKKIAGIAAEGNRSKRDETRESPNWYFDLLSSDNRKGFFISDDNFALQHTQRGKNVLYVGFDNLSSVRGKKNRDPWGYGLAVKEDWSSLGVISYRTNWFRSPRLFHELQRLAENGFFTRFKRVVFSGTSMGGYAACAFSSLAPGSTVIAFSPQSTLDPRIAGWDTRYPSGSKADWSGPYSDATIELAVAKNAWIVYDPKVEADQRHATRLEGPNVTLLKARYSSHFTAQYMSQIGLIGKFVRQCASDEMTEQKFYSMYRAGRNYRRYLSGLVTHLAQCPNVERGRKASGILRRMNRPGLAAELDRVFASGRAPDPRATKAKA